MLLILFPPSSYLPQSPSVYLKSYRPKVVIESDNYSWVHIGTPTRRFILHVFLVTETLLPVHFLEPTKHVNS